MAKKEKQDKRPVTINGHEYDFNTLSEAARNQVTNLRITDQEIEHLKRRLAIAQTARAAYANVLQAELPKQEH